MNDLIYLLSKEEYEKYKEAIPVVDKYWWLRSPGRRGCAAVVCCDGSISEENIESKECAIRPVLNYSTIKSEIIVSKKPNCFIWNETCWTIVDDIKELAISETPINLGLFDHFTNKYEKSYIRSWLLIWSEKEARKRLGRIKNNLIYLLSKKEYKKYKDKIPEINCWWWLRSPGKHPVFAAYVNDIGSVNCDGTLIDDFGAVRPALNYSNFKSEIIKSKKPNCFIWNEVRWVIIDEKNEIAISEMPIAFDRFDYESNDYEKSTIKKWLLDWSEEVREQE